MIVVEEHGDDPSSREITLTRSARRLTSPLSCPNGVSLPQMKALRASQKSKQKDASKHLTSKATERRNKAVKIRSNHSGKKNKMTNLSIKSSGFNKNLKQCQSQTEEDARHHNFSRERPSDISKISLNSFKHSFAYYHPPFKICLITNLFDLVWFFSGHF